MEKVLRRHHVVDKHLFLAIDEDAIMIVTRIDTRIVSRTATTYPTRVTCGVEKRDTR